MRCPRCQFAGTPVNGACPRCGYSDLSVTSGSLGTSSRNSGPLSPAAAKIVSSPPGGTTSPVPGIVAPPLRRGDTLRQGRYQLLEQLPLPENQQGQGSAWLASDAQVPHGRVVICEVRLREATSAGRSQIVRSITMRLSELAQHPGFPKVLDAFNEHDEYFIVLQHIEGQSLMSLLRSQGGTLPERTVAEYGRQLCELLAVMGRQDPPVVHGGISPETIIVSPDRRRVSLIHIPLLPPLEVPNSKTPSGYRAPEQAHGSAEPASDLYAVAAVMHHAVTGYDPNERMAFFHPPARRLNPAVSPQMEAILSKALRLSIPQRYARPSEMQKDLAALLATAPPEGDDHSLTSMTPASLPALYQMRQRSRNRALLEIAIPAAVVLLLLLAFVVYVARPFSAGRTNSAAPGVNLTATALATQRAWNQELALEASTYAKSGLGISDGRYAFDLFTGRQDVSDKQHAGQALQRGDLSTASQLFSQSVNEDPLDGEALIYNENLRVLQLGRPYVTIVLGLPIANNDALLGFDRSDMQAAYLLQHRVNQQNLLPNGLQLRILIDSSGANNSDVGTVAQFVANRVKLGNPDHIIAVIGWPFSSQTVNAVDILASVHIPLISQTASSVELTGISPFFFRVNAGDAQQGAAMGAYAVNDLGARTILVLRDPKDPYSNSLADAFTKSVTALHAVAINNPADYFTKTVTTVAQYQKQVMDAINDRVDVIYIAGLDVDAVRLAVELGNIASAYPASTYLANLKILGGDGLDTPLLLGQGSGPDVTLALQHPQDIQRLYFTSFGDPNEWKLEKIPPGQQPAFFSDWAATYQSSAVATAPGPDENAILTYDAAGVVIRAATLVQGTLTGDAIRTGLLKIGTGSIPAYQGVTGQIHFGTDGNPIDKVVVVLHVAPVNGQNQIVLIQIVGKFK
jgi:ABC-type branched-subunit amino acid transport system substrate-binding protein/serine/threonine protein kinase